MGIQKISEKTGFTSLEIKVISFLFVVFAIGFMIKTFILSGSSDSREMKFDYSEQDSLFWASGIDNYTDTIENVNNKNVDYKQEVLDFRKPDFDSPKTEMILAEKSISLNKADVKTLEQLPGIGPKTAAKIIEYRQSIGKFRMLDELLKVKGIGNSKFSKIKKYLYIE